MRKFKIETIHDIYVDSYENGELNYVNGWNLNADIKAENPREAIEKYFEKELYYKFNFEHLDKDEEQINKFWYSVLVDEDNTEASEAQIKDWKKDKLKLYANNITLFISEIIPVQI